MQSRMKIVVMCFVGLATTGGLKANVLWTEDFKEVSDWAVGSDPSGSSSITSDGKKGYLCVNAVSNMAAFIPDPGLSSYIPFDPLKKSDFSLTFAVDGMTASASYDISLDEFKDGREYVNTVWGVYPKGGGSTIKSGLVTINLGDYTFHPETRYIMPKITVHTGNGAQKVIFHLMEVSNVGSGK